MMESSYEDDIARAIALSLQAQTPSNHEEVNVHSEDLADDESRFQTELQRAIEASNQGSASIPSQTSIGSAPAPAHPATKFLSERAQLEQERLERLKRHRPDIHKSVSVVVVDSDDEEEEEQSRGAKRQRISPSSNATARRANTHAFASSSTTTAANNAASARAGASGIAHSQSIFWEGELRQTGNCHVDPQKDTRPVFRLTNIISPREDIEFAIVSAFCWNFPWVYSLFDRKTPVIAIDHSPSGDASIKAILPNWIRTTPFLRGGRGCMHMKFMLLFYRTGRLRVVVSTANLIEYDWRDIENSVWVQDVPRLSSPKTIDPKQKQDEDFASTIVRVLHGLNVAPALINFLRNEHPNLPLQRLEDLRAQWDFSKVKAKLIPSIAGKHEGWPKVILSGHTCLMKALRDLHASTPRDKELVLECQGSSIGTYSTQWLNEFYISARGESSEGWMDRPKASRAKLPLPPIKILFPSAQYVRDSVLGEAGGGTMFCRRHQWEGKNFPRELFHQTKSKRGRVLMHSKMVLGTFRDKRGGLVNRQQASTSSETDGEVGERPVGWVYVGSHNFTPSAWGTLSGSSFNPTLNITNYELGVLLPLRSEEIDGATCWERPPQKYDIGRDEPWIQAESASSG